ncbi:MAG TPA: FMN-binding protein [Gemmatimonadaceae bacterium]|nr:FMN-binding protein [Gemmatimonadaceae bacterium]
MANAKNNLVAMSTVAVLAVYAAGFTRTRAAAERFAEADARVRRPIPEPNLGVVDTPRVVASSSDAVSIKSQPERKTPAPERVVAAAAHRQDTVLERAAQETPAKKDSGSATTAPRTAQQAAPVPDTAAIRAAQEDSAAAADTARGPFKDGVFMGWGTSRHGDIQAAVEIRNGHIVDAYVTQCLTRYSCSWISSLPPQVVARQSANVDYVSGATESTNAFYYAIAQAISRAK